MDLHCLTAFLFLCLVPTTFADFFFGGSLRQFSASSTGFNLPSADTAMSPQYSSTNLNLLAKPTFTGSGIASISSATVFSDWWNAAGSALSPYTVKLVTAPTGLADFDFSGFTPAGSNPWWTLELMGQVAVPSPTSWKFGVAGGEMLVYINGVLQTPATQSLWGVQNSYREATVPVSAGTQTVHVFVTHRIASPSRVRILVNDFPSFTSSCGVTFARHEQPYFLPFLASNMSLLLGAAVVPNGASNALNLSSTTTFSSFAAWSTTKLRIQNGFRTHFTWSVSGCAAGNPEGFAFVVQTNGLGQTGGSGSGLGYTGITNSLAVEFDLKNSGTPIDPISPNPHIETHTRYASANSADRSFALGSTSSNLFPSGTSFTIGTLYQSVIEYQPGNAGTGSIKVFTGTATPDLPFSQTAVHSVSIDDVQVQSGIAPNGFAYAGFTTVNSDAACSVQIQTWRFWETPVNPQSNALTAGTTGVLPLLPTWNTDIARASAPPAAFQVRTHDICNTPIGLVGDIVAAQLRSFAGQVVGNTTVLETSTGFYNVQYWHRVAEVVQLWLTINGQNMQPYNVQQFLNITITPAPISAPHCRYVTEVPNAGFFSSCSQLTPCQVIAGANVTFTLTAYDQFGNLNPTPTSGFSANFIGDNAFVQTTVKNPPDYQFTGIATRAVVNNGINLRYNGVDIGTALIVPVPPTRPSGIPVTPTPITPVDVLAALPADANYTTGTVTGPGYAPGPVAGTIGTFTVAPIDIFNNPITGARFAMLPLPQFTLTCLDSAKTNETSAACDVFNSPVQYNPSVVAVGNTWQFTYNSTLALTFVLAITINNNSVPLPNLNLVTVSTAPANGQNTIFYKDLNYTAGALATFTFQAVDSFGNFIRQKPTPGDYSVTINGATAVCDSGMTSSSGTVQGLSCSFVNSGLFQASFTPVGEGSFTANVQWSGTLGGAASTTLLVITGPPDPIQSTCTTLPSPPTIVQVVAGTNLPLVITSRDRFGNVRVAANDSTLFLPSLQPQLGAFIPQGLVISSLMIQSPPTGSYDFTLTSQTAGLYDFKVFLLGNPLGQFVPDPNTIQIIPSYGNATTSLPSGPGVSGAFGDAVTTFVWQSVDSFGNLLTDTGDTLVVSISKNGGLGGPANSVTPLGAGMYSVEFTAPSYATLGDNYTIAVQLTSNGTVTNRIIGPLPLADPLDKNFGLIYYGTMNTATGVALKSAASGTSFQFLNNANSCLACGTGTCGSCFRQLDPVVAGVQSAFNITDRDLTPFPKILRTPPTAYVVRFTSPSGVVTTTSVSKIPGVPDADLFSTNFTLTVAGNYSVSVAAGGGAIPTNEATSGIFIVVNPAPLNPPTSDVSGFPTTVTAGDPVSYGLRYRDAYSNLVTTNTNSYLLTFALTRGATDLTPNVQNLQPNPLRDVVGGSGSVQITFTPTIAGICRVDTRYNNTRFGPSASVYEVTVNPSTPSQGRSCIITVPAAPPAAPGCADPLPQTIVAGKTWNMIVYIRDLFGNGVIDTQIFNVTIELNGWLTTTTVYTGGLLGDPSAGRYTLSLTPTKRVVYQQNGGIGNKVDVWALHNPSSTSSSNPPTDTLVASSHVKIDPADVDSTESFVSGLPTQVKAGTQIVFQLYLRDRFGNEWFDAPTRMSITAVGPGVTKALTIQTAGSMSDGLQQQGSNPFANYTIRYTPTKATDVFSQDFSFIIRVDGVVITPTNISTVRVIAADPYALFTTYNAPPRVGGSNQWLAGDRNNITLQLVDIYGNLLKRGGNNVTITYLDGTATCLANNVLDVSDVTTANFDPLDISDHSDGTYTIWVNTTRAGTYTGAIRVEGNLVRGCLQTDTSFNILPLEIYPPACVITGDAVVNPRTNIAGEDINVDIVLNDKYGNRVCLFCTVAPCTTCIADLSSPPQIGPWSGTGSITPTPTPTICENPGNVTNWIDLTEFPINETLKIVELSTIFGTDQTDYGTYRITFQAQKARSWKLVAAVNLLSIPGWQVVGTECVNLTILPSYVYTFNLSQDSTVWAGIPAQVGISAWDRFDNVVVDGPHYWLSTYAWPISNKQLIRYAISSRSAYDPSFNGHTLSFVLHWDGSYDVSLTLMNNPGPALNPTRTQTLIVTGATCGREQGNTTAPYRCMPEGSCYNTFAQCGALSCPFYCANGASTFPSFAVGCQTSACSTPGSRCRSGESAICSLDSNAYTSWCAASSGTCPGGTTWDDRYPNGATATCSGWFRYAASGCPTPRVCNQGMVLCTDGVTCVFDATECFTRNNSCTDTKMPFKCEDGRCVANRFDCPTPMTCSSGVLCPDGSCQPNVASCPSLYKCYDPAMLRCQDGSCRSTFDDCPSRVSCPPGWLLCESGHCVTDISQCKPINCSISDVRCPDGSCRVTFDLCATGTTCPASMPVLCSDGSCVMTVSACPAPRVCPDNWAQCPRGQCAPSFAECATGRICPANTPVLCADGSCRAHASECGTNYWKCPLHRPYRCVDGHCAASYMDCPAPQVCPSNAPVRCASGGCVPSNQMCPNQTSANMCPMGQWRCPGGGCAPSLSQCPTPVTCQVNQIRCGDGSCRSSCTGVVRNFECANGLVECPNYESGYTCAPSYDNCPQAPACPRSRPVRCADRSCQMSVSLCPPLAVFSTSRKACPGNMWTEVNCGHSSVCPPKLPTKCWDETCRLLPEDCPPQPLCSYEAPTASKVAPYLCPNGACGRNLFECTTNQPCSPPSWVKCPGYTITGNSGICAPNVSACAPLTNSSSLLVCPDGKSRCYDASCRDTCPPRACPHYISYLCPDGKCARRSTECNRANGCPSTAPTKCSDGSCAINDGACPSAASCPSGLSLCADGSCANGNCTVTDSGCPTNVTRCFSGQCAVVANQCTASSAEDYLPNGCPGTRPYRCNDGYCAIASVFCPTMTQEEFCANGLPFRCADGSCALTGAQCPYVAPCPCDSTGCWVRCGDGSCRPATAVVANVSVSDHCPLYTKCTGATAFMCPDGLCATSASECVDPWTGCPMGSSKQADGTCSDTAPAAATYGWNGCFLSIGSYKCWDGSCVGGPENCPDAPAGCDPTRQSSPGCNLWNKACGAGEVRCADGGCSALADCKTAMNCDLDKPIRCADGSCRRYPADGSGNSTTCPPVVVCPPTLPNICADGTCVADPMYCPAFWPCSTGKERCKDFTCRDSCPTITVMACPPGAPTLCRNGACVKSYRECGPEQGPVCPAVAPFKCFDGTCQSSPAGCAAIAAVVASSSAWNPNVNPDTTLCSTGETYCWNGACLPTSSAWLCPPVPSCPFDKPYRCADGSCANRTAGDTCTEPSGCASGTTRCEDGLCRTMCPLFHGCSKSQRLMCPTQATYCMSGSGDGSGDYAACNAKPQQVCGDNCFRDIHAEPQVVTASVLRDTIVDIAVSNNAPTTWVEIPAGAFGGTSSVRFAPATQEQLSSGFVVINNVPKVKTFPQAMLGTPFTCSVDNVNGGPGTAFLPLNLTVFGMVDRALYEAEEEEKLLYSTPCEWIGTWDLTSLEYQYCGGSVVFGNDKQSIQFNLTTDITTPECSNLGFSGVIVNTPVVIDGGYQVMWNVTGVALNNAQNITVGQNVCTTLINVGSRRVYMSLTDLSLCVDADANQPTTIRALRADNPATFTNPDACQDAANSALIQQIDICFGQYEVGRREFQCFGHYYERMEDDPLGFPSWVPASGRPGNVVRGRLRQCKPNTFYGFFYVPLPPIPRETLKGKSAWDRYGKIVLGVSVPVIFILCLLAYALWRLKRYRDKYKEEQAEANQLRETAAEIAETHGGLGVWDEEVQMVSNPLVLQFNEQKRKLDEVDKSLEAKAEMDRTEMEKLDKERQIIVEEMNRLKQLLAKQQEAKKAQRVDDAPAVQPAVSGAPRGGGGGGPSPDWDSSSGPDQHTFQPEALGAKPRKKEI